MSISDNRELTLKEIKAVELELLIQFHKICEQLSLRYSLGGGTLLGAIRHKGFIPWDDDIDVMMPRPDYDIFIEYYKNNNDIPFLLYSYETNATYIFLESKIASSSTVIIDDSLNTNDQTSMGVYIDIFPLDGLGATKKEAINQFMKTSIKREIVNARTWKTFFRSKTHKIYYEPIRLTVYFASRIMNPQKLLRDIDKINRSIDFDTSVYAGCVCGAYRTKEIMRREIFSEYVKVEFEGNEFLAIREYGSYLEKHYGDYMKLPPIEKRTTHHSFRAYWKDI